MKQKSLEVPAQLYKAYRELRKGAEKAFDAFRARDNKGAIACKPGCVDCCHALFGLFPIEALIVHKAFMSLPKKLRTEIVDKAELVLEKLKLIHELDRRSDFSVSNKIERLRLRCPFLNDKGLCAIYEDRPITCRVYGIPILFKGSIHQCHKTVTKEETGVFNLDMVNHNLYILSLGLVSSLKVRDKDKAKLILSVPMAILNPLAPIINDGQSDEKNFKIGNEKNITALEKEISGTWEQI